jgi:hypothetical protein
MIPFRARKRIHFGERGSYIEIDDASHGITFHHFNGNIVLGLFGTIWVAGWTTGLVLCARETQSPWSLHDYEIILAMSAISLLVAFVTLAEFVQHDLLIFDGDSITSVVRVICEVRRRTISISDVADLRLEESRARGIVYSIVIDRKADKRRQWVRFGKGLHPGVLLQMISLMMPIIEQHSTDIGPVASEGS